MIDYELLQSALINLLKDIEFSTTGAITISAVNQSFIRSSGSFVDDRFYAGMEVTGTGLGDAANEAASVIEEVTDTTLTVDRALITEAAGAGKTLSLLLPSKRGWENVKLDPQSGYPYIEEEMVPGPATHATVGNPGWEDFFPLWTIRVSVPIEVGSSCLNRYSDGILGLFPPNLAGTLSTGDTWRVRTDPAPFREQSVNIRKGWITAPVTIPIWLRTYNS